MNLPNCFWVCVPVCGPKPVDPEKKKAPALQGLTTNCKLLPTIKMDDTRPELRRNVKAKTTWDDDLYARLYALDPGLAQLLEVWPMLARDNRQAIVDQAIQSASVTKETN